MWCSKLLKYILFQVVFLVLNCSATEKMNLKAASYVVCSIERNELWSTYLYQQLQQRIKDPSVVLYSDSSPKVQNNKTAKQLYIQIDNQLEDDYCINHKGNVLEIKTRDSKTMKWIVYQLIEALSQEDTRFTATDLNPATLNFTTQCTSFDFQYREPYYRSNLAVDQSEVNGNNNVELDWGIWGHNLSKVLKDIKDPAIYAKVDGKLIEEQYCFSSLVLQQAITTHLIDNFGYGIEGEQEYNFLIAPQDNDIVCGCVKCKQQNQGAEDASESMAYLINQLALQFPKHQFFMLLYRTTRKVPKVTLAANIGVFLSTVDVPKGIDLSTICQSNKQVREFISQVKQWKTRTPHVYLWDYSANFDDYLSPIPVLYALQKQLAFFKEIGVTGVFLNASGYEYASFDEMQYYVATALMKEVNQPIDRLIERYFDKFYPKSKTILTSYYLRLEQEYSNKLIPYAMYGSTTAMLQTYLDEEEFLKFYAQIEKACSYTTGQEHILLKQLWVGLTFTRMQIAYCKGNKKNGLIRQEGNTVYFVAASKQWIEIMRTAQSLDITQYKEVGGDLQEYIQQWSELIQPTAYQNLLLNELITILSKTDEDFESSTLLNNGLVGLPIDYHFGWYSSRDDLHVSFPTNKLEGKKEVILQFLVNERHHFQMPEYIEFWLDNHLVKRISKQAFIVKDQLAQCKVSIDFKASKRMEIKCVKPQRVRAVLACDEIQILN